jgi:hypothetical protein
MPQTTDQLHAAIMNLPCKPPRGTSERREYEDEPEAVLRAYIEGHRDARHAAAELVSAVPLVAEAPREPVAWMWQHGETGMTGFVQHAPDDELRQWERMNKPRKIVSPLYAALHASLAPMPEECSVSQWSSRCCERGTKGCTVSHLRTAPRPTLSDEHRQMLGEIEQEFVALPDLAAWIRRLQDRLREALASARADALLRELVVSIEEYEKVECIDVGRVRRKRRDAAFAKAQAYTRGAPETDRAAMTSTTAKEPK